MHYCVRLLRPTYLVYEIKTLHFVKKRSYSKFIFLSRKNHEFPMLESQVIRGTDDPILPEFPTIYYEDGYRKVKSCYLAGKIKICGKDGKSLKEMRNNYRSQSDENLQKECDSRRYFMNGKAIESVKEMESVTKHNDEIVYCYHNHTSPVNGKAMEIVHEDDECLVVNKPCGMPATVSGLHLHNNAYQILVAERKMQLHMVHRIDKMTSGILIFGKTKAFAMNCYNNQNWKKVRKVYIGKVAGKFPPGEIECTAAISPTGLGIMKVEPNGKQSRSVFRALHYDGETSLVECRLYTGRTHQIRVHLQYLGYPIVDDPVYNHWSWGEARFTPGAKCGDLIRQVARQRYLELRSSKIKEEGVVGDPLCDSCCNPFAWSPPLTMCLHSYEYSSPWWTFKCDLPSWTVFDHPKFTCF